MSGKKNPTVIDTEVVSSKSNQPPSTSRSLQVRDPHQMLTTSQMMSKLDAIRQVMKEAMEEGQDYGKIPGCGPKPGLFQPGAQKLSMMFQLNPSIREEIVTDFPNFHRGYRLVVRVTNGEKFAEGVGECSTLESKYRYRGGNRVCPDCGKETVFKSKRDEGWFCWAQKGGCGAQFMPGSPGMKKLMSQKVGKVENENPADAWNTCRKLAFKRAFVHAIINATNTSELWTQDVDETDFPGDDGDLGPQRGKKNGNGKQQPAKPAAGEESEKDKTRRTTLLALLGKQFATAKLNEADAVRFFQNVQSQSKKWKGQLMLGIGVDGTFTKMGLDKLEFIVQKFNNWQPECEKWCKEHPIQQS